jgi:hypothetical protein
VFGQAVALSERSPELLRRLSIRNRLKTYLEALLTGLDSSDVTSDTTTDDDQIVLGCCKPGETGKVSDCKILGARTTGSSHSAIAPQSSQELTSIRGVTTF